MQAQPEGLAPTADVAEAFAEAEYQRTLLQVLMEHARQLEKRYLLGAWLSGSISAVAAMVALVAQVNGYLDHVSVAVPPLSTRVAISVIVVTALCTFAIEGMFIQRSKVKRMLLEAEQARLDAAIRNATRGLVERERQLADDR